MTNAKRYPLDRIALTFMWAVGLVAFLRWWEITLRLPSVMLWTAALAALFLATAWWLRGRRLPARGDPLWHRFALWMSVVPLTLLAIAIVPEIRIGATPVQTVAFAGVLDVVFPGWIAVSAVTLLWEGPARYVILGAIPILLLLGIWAFVIRMPGTSFAGPLPPLLSEGEMRRDRLEQHVRVLSVEIGVRSDERYQAVQAAARYLDSTLGAMGYEVFSQEFTYAGSTYRNLEVVVPGTERPDEIVVVGAHYDTAEDAPGADDNASGVAGVLELAHAFAAERPRRTIHFVLFASEEPPFFATEWMGSYAYAARAAEHGERIVAMLSLETIGYYSTEPGSQQYPPPFSFFYPSRGDFIGFVGNLSSGRLVRRCLGTFRERARFPSEGVASPTWIPGITWSDHLSFWQHGFKAIMITDTAPFRNPFYHTGNDTIDQLDFDRMTRVVAGIVHVVRDLAAGD